MAWSFPFHRSLVSLTGGWFNGLHQGNGRGESAVKENQRGAEIKVKVDSGYALEFSFPSPSADGQPPPAWLDSGGEVAMAFHEFKDIFPD